MRCRIQSRMQARASEPGRSGPSGSFMATLAGAQSYALKEPLAAATQHSGPGALTPEMVFGVLSLPWAFIVIVTTVPQAKKPVFAECLGVMPAHECCGCGVQGLSPWCKPHR